MPEHKSESGQLSSDLDLDPKPASYEPVPDDERDQLCFALFRELERIEHLMAA